MKKIIVFCFLVTILFSPLDRAYAQTVDIAERTEMLAQIEKLLELIALLQIQLEFRKSQELQNSENLVFESTDLGISFEYPSEWGELRLSKLEQTEGHIILILVEKYDALFAAAPLNNYESVPRWPYWFEVLGDISEDCVEKGDCTKSVNKNGYSIYRVERSLFDSPTKDPYWQVSLPNSKYPTLHLTVERIGRTYPSEFMSLSEAISGIELIVESIDSL